MLLFVHLSQLKTRTSSFIDEQPAGCWQQTKLQKCQCVSWFIYSAICLCYDVSFILPRCTWMMKSYKFVISLIINGTRAWFGGQLYGWHLVIRVLYTYLTYQIATKYFQHHYQMHSIGFYDCEQNACINRDFFITNITVLPQRGLVLIPVISTSAFADFSHT